MSEAPVVDQSLEFGLNSREVRFDRATNSVIKVIRQPLEHDGGKFETADLFTLKRIGASVELITDPRWGFRDILPENIKFEVVENPQLSSGYEAHIQTDYIKGKALSSMDSVPDSTSAQLVRFIEGSARMVKDTRRLSRTIMLPDLLGGIKRPKDKFCNFIVEDDTQLLKFIDLYPLAQLPAGFDLWQVRRNYVHHLRLAAKYLQNDQVIKATEDLIKTIVKGNK